MVDITRQDREAFERDGAVIIRGAFSRQWLDIVEKGIMYNVESPSDHGRFTDPETKKFFQDSDNWRRIEYFRDFVFNSPAKEIAAALMGSRKINFLHDHVLYKLAGASQRTLWHQDQPYSPVDGNEYCTMWLPIDPVVKETALEFVAGSHRWGKWFRPQIFATGELRAGDDERWEILPDIEAARDEYSIISWPLEPGDCLVFHGLTLHGAAGNPTSLPRRVLSTRWTGDDAIFRRRSGKMSPPEPASGGPENGGVLDSPAFPVVWRAED